MIRHYVLTFNASVQNLASVVGGGANGPNDLPLRAISLQPDTANAAACYVGGAEGVATLAAGTAGVRLEAAAAGVPPAPFILGEFTNTPMKLSDFAVTGANNEKLHILAVH